jgi:hypothetical protein
LVPVIRALKGQLPIELSLRGARYEETQATAAALKSLEARVVQLEQRVPASATLVKDAVERVAALEDQVAAMPRR